MPLERLFLRLEHAGFDTSPRVRLLVWEALHKDGNNYLGNIQELPWLLTPLLAKSAQQQELLQDIFARFLDECEEEGLQLGEDPLKTNDPPPLLPRPKNRWWLALLLPLIAVALWQFFQNPQPKNLSFQLSENGLVRAGDTLLLQNLSQGLPEGDTAFVWEVREDTLETPLLAYHHLPVDENAPQDGSFVGTALVQHWVVPDYENRDIRILLRHANHPELEPFTANFKVHCSDPPVLSELVIPDSALRIGQPYVFTAVTDGPARVEWTVNGEAFAATPSVVSDTVTHTWEHTFDESGEFELQCAAYDLASPKHCFTRQEPVSIIVGNNQPVLPLAELKMDRPRLLLTMANWVWLLLLLPLLLATWLLWRAQQRKAADPSLLTKSPEQLEAEHPIHDAAPYFIPYQDRNPLIQVPADFFRMADVLRRRAESERRSFDALASVKATIDGGGFPQLLEATDSLPSDYLVLAERPTNRHQQGRLWERLTSFWQQQDAPVSVWYHDGSFRSFWQKEQTDTQSLAQLQRRFSGHRLIVLGNGEGLLNPHDTHRPALLAAPIQTLEQWPSRLLLTPSPPAAWTYREQLLHRHFLLFPADRRGLLEGLRELEALEEFEPGTYQGHEATQQARRSTRHHLYRDWTSVDAHLDYLADDPEALRWLCGLAVSASPDWNLTLAIGRALGVEVTHDRLLALTRIPWLASNEDSTSLRLELLRRLSRTDEAAARQAALDELEAVREQTAGSFAELEWKSQRALQYFALDPGDAAHKGLIRDLKAAGLLSESQLRELDFTVKERLARSPDLPEEAYADLDHWLDAVAKPPFWNPWRKAAGLLLLTALGLMVAAFAYNRQAYELPEDGRLSFWQQTNPLDDAALERHNEAVAMAQRMPVVSENFNYWLPFLRDSALMTDIAFREALGLRGGDYALLDSNLAAFHYNWAAIRANIHISGDEDARWWLDDGEGRVYANTDFSRVEQRVQAWQEAAMQFGIAYRLATKGNPSLLPDALHGRGLSYYYSFRQLPDSLHYCDSARSIFQQILDLTDGQYFETPSTASPVNLASLLAEVSCASAAEALIATRGRVVDRSSGQPISGVQLRVATANTITQQQLREGTNPEVRLAVTGANGQFVFPDLPTGGTWQIYAIADGYEALDTRRQASTSWGDLRMKNTTEGPSEQRYRGRIIASTTREPIAAATLQIEGIPAAVTTDAQGYYTYTLPIGQAAEGLNVNIFTSDGVMVTFTTVVDKQDTNPITLQTYTLLQEVNPLRDKDRDGVIDTEDRCPDTPGLVELGGCPDQDGDGIADIDDNCPEEAGTAEFQGCPSLPEQGGAGGGGNALTIADIGTNMIRVAGGEFIMGCQEGRDSDCYDWEKPPHPVTVSTFYMSKYEVTQAQWRAVMGSDPPELYNTGCYLCPVENVSWDDIQAFLQKLNAQTGQNYRLPTEAEWEYAARGGQAGKTNNYIYSGSNELDEVAWYNSNAREGNTHGSQKTTRPVGGKKSNELGLYDMSGNVYEWCSDWYGDYTSSAQQNPLGPSGGSRRVFRGGSWIFNPQSCRAAGRGRDTPTYRSGNLGFRLARSF